MPDLDWYAIIFIVVIGFLIGYGMRSPAMFQVEIGFLEQTEETAADELLSDDKTLQCADCPFADVCGDADASSSDSTPKRDTLAPCVCPSEISVD